MWDNYYLHPDSVLNKALSEVVKCILYIRKIVLCILCSVLCGLQTISLHFSLKYKSQNFHSMQWGGFPMNWSRCRPDVHLVEQINELECDLEIWREDICPDRPNFTLFTKKAACSKIIHSQRQMLYTNMRYAPLWLGWKDNLLHLRYLTWFCRHQNITLTH